MADQAQGLRALVNRARQDHADNSLPATALPGDTALKEREEGEFLDHADVLNPDSRHCEENSAPVMVEEAVSDLRQVEIGKAAVAVRVREHIPAMAPVPAASRRADGYDVHGNPIAAFANAAPARQVARVVAITSGKGELAKPISVPISPSRSRLAASA